MVPDFNTIMLPLLKLLGDDQIHKGSELIPKLADQLKLSEEDRNEMLASGNSLKFDNRVYWSLSYMKHAGLLYYPSRGNCRITEDGLKILSNPPQAIDFKYLYSIPQYRQYQERLRANRKGAKPETHLDAVSVELPIDEVIEESFSSLLKMLSTEILDKIKSCTPKFFEYLVVDLLLKMGYGGSKVEAGEVLGKSNDGGIDGLIKEDKLGLDTIYVQAKKWDSMVPIAQVRDFAGALLAKKAKKGIFITTSSFPSSAREFVASIEPRIVLIDGEQLAELMIEYDLGVSVKRTYQIKKLDLDYYEEN